VFPNNVSFDNAVYNTNKDGLPGHALITLFCVSTYSWCRYDLMMVLHNVSALYLPPKCLLHTCKCGQVPVSTIKQNISTSV